jgi:hypothetical protein
MSSSKKCAGRALGGLVASLVALTMMVAPSRADAAFVSPRIVKIDSGSLTVVDVDADAPGAPDIDAEPFKASWWLPPSSAASLSASACAGHVKGAVTITATRSADPTDKSVKINMIATLHRTTAGCFELQQLASKSYSDVLPAGQTGNASIKLGTADHLTVKFTIKNTELGIAIEPPTSR